jgi:integrase
MWIADLEATHDKRTAHEYELVATKWAERWKTLGEIATSAIGDYQRDRLREVSRETVRKNRVQLRSFLAWCFEQDLMDEVPAMPPLPKRALGTPTRTAVERIPISPGDVRKLIAKLPKLGTESKSHEQFFVKDWANVAWQTGLRPITIAKLKTPEHFKKGDTSLRITADIDKARWARTLPLTSIAIRALERCLPDEPGLIFGWHDYREHLERAGKKALKRKVLPYDFRHSRITCWVEEGKDLLGIQWLVGHVDLSTTSRYAHASSQAARRVLGLTG